MSDSRSLLQYLGMQIEGNAFALVGVGAAFCVFWAVGRLLIGRTAGSPALAGWAASYLLAILLATLGIHELRLLLLLLPAAAIVGMIRMRRELRPQPDTILAFLLLAPLAALALVIPLMHWDSFWHWVLNASYLHRFDRFPALPLEGFPSFHPMYPEATSLVFYFASEVTGRLAETAGTYLNIAVTLIALVTVTRVLRQMLETAGVKRPQGLAQLIRVPLVAFCVVLVFNPAVRTTNFFAAIADPILGVVVLVLMLTWCLSVLPAESRAHEQVPRADVINLFLLGALLSGTKHSGMVLALLLMVAGVIAALLLRLSWRRWLLPSLALVAGAVLAQLLWKLYLARHLPMQDQFSIRPLADWRFDLLPALLQGVLIELQSLPEYYGLVLIGVALGVACAFRPGLSGNRSLSLALATTALAMTAHLAILLMAYLGSGFNEMEIRRAASLQRYSSHIGYALCSLTLMAAVLRLQPWVAGLVSRWNSRVVAATALALCAAGFAYFVALPAGFDASYFRKTQQQRRELAAAVVQGLPREQNFAVFASEWVANFISYESWQPAGHSPGPTLKNRKIVKSEADLPVSRELLAKWIVDPSIDNILLVDADPMNAELGLPLAKNFIWNRSTGQWRPLD